jgi:hypothetical protein
MIFSEVNYTRGKYRLTLTPFILLIVSALLSKAVIASDWDVMHYSDPFTDETTTLAYGDNGRIVYGSDCDYIVFLGTSQSDISKMDLRVDKETSVVKKFSTKSELPIYLSLLEFRDSFIAGDKFIYRFDGGQIRTVSLRGFANAYQNMGCNSKTAIEESSVDSKIQGLVELINSTDKNLGLYKLEQERVAQERALSNIFKGVEQPKSNTSSLDADELRRYSAIYTQLIQSRLKVAEGYRGKSCRLNIRFYPVGNEALVRDIRILSGDEKLCEASKSAVLLVGQFPSPDDEQVARALSNINLTIVPE